MYILITSPEVVITRLNPGGFIVKRVKYFFGVFYPSIDTPPLFCLTKSLPWVTLTPRDPEPLE